MCGGLVSGFLERKRDGMKEIIYTSLLCFLVVWWMMKYWNIAEKMDEIHKKYGFLERELYQWKQTANFAKKGVVILLNTLDQERCMNLHEPIVEFSDSEKNLTQFSNITKQIVKTPAFRCYPVPNRTQPACHFCTEADEENEV